MALILGSVLQRGKAPAEIPQDWAPDDKAEGLQQVTSENVQS